MNINAYLKDVEVWLKETQTYLEGLLETIKHGNLDRKVRHQELMRVRRMIRLKNRVVAVRNDLLKAATTTPKEA